MAGPFAGLRVLDLTSGQAGGVATMILADLGAEVIKVERPGGDPFRTAAAAPMWLRGKQSVVLNLKDAADRPRLHALVPTADVLVFSGRAGVAERLGADYATVAPLNPRLIYCAIGGFGPRGPYSRYKGYEGLVAAKSGRMMSFAGQLPRPGPIYAALPVATHATAQAAFQGIVAALLARERTGRGQLVETSMLQGMLPYDLGGLILQQLMQRYPEQFPVDPNVALARMPTLQYHPVMTADNRWLQLANLMEHLFHNYIDAAGLGEIYADPRFVTAPALGDAEREELRNLMLQRMRERTCDEWMAIFIAQGSVAAEPIVCAQAGLEHPQAIHNGDVIAVDHPRLGRMRQIGPVARFPLTPAAPCPSSPEVGEHDGAVTYPLSPSLGGKGDDGGPGSAEARAKQAPPSRREAGGGRGEVPPLDGVTVVEFGTIIATPYAGTLLADLGARVIKVEPPEGDPYRGMGNGVGTIKTTAGKESICIDLKAAAGRKIATRLLARADVVLHNFRPGVAERLGIGYEDVRAYNSRVVYVSAMGYGIDGPHALRPITHPAAGAAMGGAHLQAGGDPPEPPTDLDGIREYARRFSRANEVNPDPNAGLVFASAALVGLWARHITGQGQHVAASMLTGNAYANLDDFLSYEGKPPRPYPDRELHGLNALYRLYQTAAGWIFLACPQEHEWRALCAALDRPDLAADSRFATPAARQQHDAELIETLAAIFAERGADEWEALLSARDVGCVRADGPAPGVFWNTDPHVRENRFVREANHARWGRYDRHGPVVTFSDTPERAEGGVLGGEQSAALLREAGYDDAQIADLFAQGVVHAES